MKKNLLLLPLIVALCGCGSMGDRLASVGSPPPLTPIQDPIREPEYQPVSMPMPRMQEASYQPNSLWRTGARAFFKDQRAAQVGDILTVLISIDDEAKINNESARSRNNEESAGMPSFLGLESHFGAFLPEAISPSSLIDFGGTTNNQGKGSISRNEEIDLKVAAVVTQVLPNGNMVIRGNQEVRVNFERRDLVITGVVRPQDISATNTISYEKIAEARIAYGGTGQITDVQQPRYGQQVFDIIWPF